MSSNRISLFLLALFVTCAALPSFGQCGNENCGLVIRGRVTDLELERRKDELLFFVNLDVEFVNEGSQPIILFTNEFPEGYWLGGWSLYENADTKSGAIFRDGYWQSIIGSDSYRELAEKLDVAAPPSENTKLLRPKEVWRFPDDFVLSFEAEKHSRFPEQKTWKEMQDYPSTLYLTISYELSPWNVEYFKPNLIRKLSRRWKDHGNVLVERVRDGRFNHFVISSERMLIDLSKAKPKLVSATN